MQIPKQWCSGATLHPVQEFCMLEVSIGQEEIYPLPQSKPQQLQRGSLDQGRLHSGYMSMFPFVGGSCLGRGIGYGACHCWPFCLPPQPDPLSPCLVNPLSTAPLLHSALALLSPAVKLLPPCTLLLVLVCAGLCANNCYAAAKCYAMASTSAAHAVPMCTLLRIVP